jgi:predicted ester cyclase
MELEENKQMVRELMARLDARDIDGVLSYCAPDTVWNGFAPQPLDNAGYRQAIQVFLDAFPDSRFPVQRVLAEGNKVAAPHQLRGTHNGAFQGISPTGNPVVVDAIAIFQITNHKVAEVWLNAEIFGLLMQIGAIAAPHPV